MFAKIFSFQPSGPRKGLRYPEADKIDDFYDRLADGLKRLEDTIRPQPPSFTLKSLSEAVGLVRTLLTDVHTIVQELGVPDHVSTRSDHLHSYMDMTKNVLETCLRMRTGILQLESYELSLEHALTSLGSAVGSLNLKAKAEGEGEEEEEEEEAEEDSSSKVRSSLEACKKELQRMESKKRKDFCAEAKSGSGQLLDRTSSEESKSGNKDKELAITRSIVRVMLPNLSPGKRAFEVSFAIVDAEYVTNFIGCLILWVLSDSPEKLSEALDHLSIKVKKPNGHTQWYVCLQHLRAKIADIESKNEKKDAGDSLRVNSIREFEDVRGRIVSMYETIEAGLKAPDGGYKGLKGGPGRSGTKLPKEHEITKAKLAEIMSSSEGLASESNETYMEIVSRRKKLLDESVETEVARMSSKSPSP